ncbi:MAG: hypothetical protein WCV72_04235 [Patescibacteria group bacterium]
MQIKKPERFLKIAISAIGLAILVGGVFANGKNSSLSPKIDANLGSASATNFDNYSITTKIGACEQTTAAQPNVDIFVEVENLDKVLSGTNALDLEFIDPIAAAVKAGRISSTAIIPGAKYQFAVADGQTTFWKCVLENHPLFTVVQDAGDATSSFLGRTNIFTNEVKKFSYVISQQQEVNQFLNFVVAPHGETILETTVLNPAGEVFFKVFELEYTDSKNYNELRQLLRSRVGVTNLRPSVFGPDSYYWMWGENDKMAASVFIAGNRIFGMSYQTIHFKSIRRMIDSFQSKIAAIEKQIAFVKNLDHTFDNLTVAEFTNMTEADFTHDIWQKLQSFNADASNLSANILDAAPAGATEIVIQTNANAEPVVVKTEPITPAAIENSEATTPTETPATITETPESAPTDEIPTPTPAITDFEPLPIPTVTENADELIPASL